MRDDDPVTGRRFLTQSAYADDRHLRSRVAIYAYAEDRGNPRWRTDAVPMELISAFGTERRSDPPVIR